MCLTMKTRILTKNISMFDPPKMAFNKAIDVFIGFLKATIQIGGFYILNNGSQLCSDPDAVGWFPPFSLSHPSIVFGLNPVCKDQIGIVYVGVFHHKTQIHTFYL